MTDHHSLLKPKRINKMYKNSYHHEPFRIKRLVESKAIDTENKMRYIRELQQLNTDGKYTSKINSLLADLYNIEEETIIVDQRKLEKALKTEDKSKDDTNVQKEKKVSKKASKKVNGFYTSIEDVQNSKKIVDGYIENLF